MIFLIFCVLCIPIIQLIGGWCMRYHTPKKINSWIGYRTTNAMKNATLETGYTWYWSRSRQELWNKGATSGHLQKVISIYSDCDNDTLLLNVKQTGVACHTGSYSCFFNEMYQSEED